jgi:hypothetical protein
VETGYRPNSEAGQNFNVEKSHTAAIHSLFPDCHKSLGTHKNKMSDLENDGPDIAVSQTSFSNVGLVHDAGAFARAPDENPSMTEDAACEVCHDSAVYYESVDPAKLEESADAKNCPGCMFVKEALMQFGVDFATPGLDIGVLSGRKTGVGCRVRCRDNTKDIATRGVDLELFGHPGELRMPGE